MRKKLIPIFITLILILAVAWLFIHRKAIQERTNLIKAKIHSMAGRIPIVKKFVPTPEKPTEAEKPPEQEGEKKQEIIEVKGFKVAQIHFIDTLPVIGTIRGAKKINLRFEINGTIAGFNFREGDIVSEGDIIAELDHTDAQLKVKFRESKLNAARTRMMAGEEKLKQHQKLFDVGAIIKTKLDEINYEYKNSEEEFKAAQVELESAKLELEKTYIRSPIDGVLESKDAEEGEYVTSNVLVATLGEITEVYLEMGIIEKDLEKIKIGQKISLRVDTYPDEEFTGEVDNIFPVIEGKSRTLTVRAKIQNPDNKLLPGMFARGFITVYEKEDAIVAPPMAIDKTEEGHRVLVIDSDNILHPKPVEVEYTGSPEYWVISEGIAPGEVIVNEVVTSQISQLKEGDRVEVLETEEYTL